MLTLPANTPAVAVESPTVKVVVALGASESDGALIRMNPAGTLTLPMVRVALPVFLIVKVLLVMVDVSSTEVPKLVPLPTLVAVVPLGMDWALKLTAAAGAVTVPLMVKLKTLLFASLVAKSTVPENE